MIKIGFMILTNQILLDICDSLTGETDNQIDFNLKLNEKLKEFNTTRQASVIWHSSGRGRMSMGMVYGVDGQILQF